MTAESAPHHLRLTVGGADASLDEQLGARLDEHNVAATGHDDQTELTVRVDDGSGSLAGGVSGWTWGTCAGLSMVWVRDDLRGTGWGRRLMEAAEQVARERGCVQVLVSSFTFQAPDFYRGLGYVEFARSEGIPVAGSADVHLVKRLAP